jgi:electron transport complex protein RnfD
LELFVAGKKEHELIVSVSPHVKGEETIGRIMWTVNLALFPAFIMALYYFGPKALYVTGLCIVTCIFSEYLFQKGLNKKVTVQDGSAFLTGLLLGLNLPPSLPFYIPVVGSFVAIVITKLLFGGLGYNIFNPALIGRAFLLISWPKAMTIWSEPTAAFVALDAKTTATPLGILKEEGLQKLIEVFGDKTELYTQLLIGNRAGSLGETASIALILGACYLLYKRYITWHIPVSFLATVAVLAWIFGGESVFTGDPVIHLLSGGLLKGGFPEGVMFAILLMNCFAPLIDRSVQTKLFGAVKEKKK